MTVNSAAMRLKIHPETSTKPSDNHELNEKKSQYRFVVDILVSSLLNSTIHGASRTVGSDYVSIRLMWLCFLLTSAAFCIYMITITFISYFNYETLSKTEKIHLLSSEFPAVTICDTNPYTTNESFRFIDELLLKNKLINRTSDINTLFYNLDASDYLFYRYFVGTNALDPNRTDQFRQSLGRKLSDMLFSCTYNMQPCTVDDFSWYFDIYYGNCYTFNSGKYANGSVSKIKKSTKIGAINGLRVELLTTEPVDSSSLSISTGARVVVHNQTRMPSLYEGILVPVGEQTYLEVTRMFASLLPQPYSNCVNTINVKHPSRLVQAILATGYEYTQQDCFYACFQYYLIYRCGCFDFSSLLTTSMLTSQNVTPCLNYTQMLCNSNTYIEFFSLDVKSYCAKDCPLECRAVKYNSYMSHAEFPSWVYASVLINNPKIIALYESLFGGLERPTISSLKKNMLEITVFYADMGYDFYQEVAKMDIIDLISNIGGTLGLFLGMSFLSLLEIIDVILQICFHRSPPKPANQDKISSFVKL